MPRLTDEQRDERPNGLGATDVVTAAGLGYNTPYELYLEKIGELDPEARIDDASRGRMERGHRLEDVALEWDRDINGEPFYRVTRTVWHPTISFLYCHPDATRDRFGKLTHLVEVKTSPRRWKEVRRATEVQVQVQMACSGATAVDVIVLTFEGAPQRFVVERDDELIEALEQLAVAFWERVQRKEPPPMDGSDGASRWLDRTRFRNEPQITASDDQRALVDRLLELRRAVKLLQGEDDKLVNDLKLTMGGASRLVVPGIANVIWTAPTTFTNVSWKEVASAYRKAIEEAASKPWMIVDDVEWPDLDAIESLYSKVREDVRTIRIYDQRED